MLDLISRRPQADGDIDLWTFACGERETRAATQKAASSYNISSHVGHRPTATMTFACGERETGLATEGGIEI